MLASTHGNKIEGGSSSVCMFDQDDRIIRVRGLFSDSNSGLQELEFITESWNKCIIGSGTPSSFDLLHEGYYLEYLSGTSGEDSNSGIEIIKTLTFNWKKKPIGML